MPKPVDLTEKLSSWRTRPPGPAKPDAAGAPRSASFERGLSFDFFSGMVYALFAAVLLAQLILLAAMG